MHLIIAFVFTFMSEAVFACSCDVFDPEKLWEDKQLGGAEVSFPTVILVEINKVEYDKAYYDQQRWSNYVIFSVGSISGSWRMFTLMALMLLMS